VSRLEGIIEDLKSLPPDGLAMVADDTRDLKPISEEGRRAALERTFGYVSPEPVDPIKRTIEEGCEQINEQSR
jgi:ABC-type phosphonate transport system ATPase subunit